MSADTNPSGTAPNAATAPKDADHISGHRSRMRDKVMDKGAAALSELELLEMILYAASARRDTKPLAKDLIRHFGSLSGVLRAPNDKLLALAGVGKATVTAIRIAEATGLYLSHSTISNRLIAEETLSQGTVDQTPVYVREVINVALKHHAKAVILVHNHPSGETEPSRADIDMTTELKKALGLVTVTLHDHLIVAGFEVVSFKSLGLL
jgi:DNA repair protein RadC